MHYPESLDDPRAAAPAASDGRVRAWIARWLIPMWLWIERRTGLGTFALFRAEMESEARSADADLTVRWLSVSEAVAAAADVELDLAPVWTRRAYSRGDRCLGAYLDGRLAGYLWTSRGHALRDERVAVRIAENAQYRFKAFVRVAHRGRGIAPALYRAANRLGAAAGMTHALLCVSPFNGPSLAAVRNSGARRVGFVVTWCFGGRVRAWRSPGAARNGLHVRP